MEYLDKDQRKILKTIIELWKSQDCNQITDKALKSKLSEYNMNQILRFLYELESRKFVALGTNADTRYITLLEGGRHYFAKLRKTIILECLRSFLFPMVIAFITALLTYLITT